MDTGTLAPGMKNDTAETPRLSFFQRLVGIYFEPRKTFEDIKRHRSWLVIFLIVTVLFMAASYTAVSRVDPETAARKAIEQNPFTRNLPEEQMQAAIARGSSPMMRYMSTALAPVGVLATYAVVAGVLLLIFVLFGASLNFRQSFAVTVWGMGAPGIVHMLLVIVSALLKDPEALDIFDVTNNVVSNLGPLADQKAHPVIHSLLRSVDLFSFWTIYLLSVGFSVFSDRKLTVGKAAIGILLAWGLYVVGKAGIAAAFS